MLAVPDAKPANSRAALTFLFIGNVMIGAGVLAPAAMINAMTEDLNVSAVAIGALIGWGAVILCIGAPAFGFFTNRIDRRTLLAASLLLYVVGHAVSAFATDYATLLAVRLLMISGAAIFTPQAASAVALLVPEAKRASAVATVFMGWAVAGAVIIPLMTIFAEIIDWRLIYGGIAVGSALSAAGVFLALPAGLYPARLSLKSWAGVVTHPAILVLLAATCVQVAGQFTLFPYLAAELRRAAGADASAIALSLGLYGGAGLFGSILAARTVGRLGAPRTHMIALTSMAIGLAGWSFFATLLVPAIASVLVWGLGFGAAIAMQQARLIAVAPALASASVALNTSVLYLGQAGGSAIGGALITHEMHGFMGPTGVAFLLGAIAASWWAKRRFAA